MILMPILNKRTAGLAHISERSYIKAFEYYIPHCGIIIIILAII